MLCWLAIFYCPDPQHSAVCGSTLHMPSLVNEDARFRAKLTHFRPGEKAMEAEIAGRSNQVAD